MEPLGYFDPAGFCKVGDKVRGPVEGGVPRVLDIRIAAVVGTYEPSRLSLNHWSQDDTEAWLPLVTRGLNPNLYIHGCVYCQLWGRSQFYLPLPIMFYLPACPSVPMDRTVFFLNMFLEFGPRRQMISCRWPGGIPEPAGCGDQTWTSPLADHLQKIGSPECLRKLFLRYATKRMRSWI